MGLCIRPRRFPPLAAADSPGENDPGVDAESTANVGPGNEYSATETKFLQLRHAHGIQGVLQVHQAQEWCIVMVTCYHAFI